jgi:Sushi repeat (SCR repeat)
MQRDRLEVFLFAMFHRLLINTGVQCPAISVANSNLNTTDVFYATFVNVSCQPGFRGFNGVNWIVTYCQDNKTWSTPPVMNCACKLVRLIDRNKIGHDITFSQYGKHANCLIQVPYGVQSDAVNCAVQLKHDAKPLLNVTPHRSV